jgi:hypothetical protein
MSFISESVGFIRRNGVFAVVAHLLEIYLGAFLRIFPGPEGLFLRGLFYRLLFKSSGKDLLIYPFVYIIFTRRMIVGKRLAVNINSYIDGRGGITIGDNVKIGANSVVLKSVPPNSTVIGVPARIIKSQGERLPDATMDHTNMPDPTADRFAALEMELIELRKKLDNRDSGTTR